jgi:hypothetical protein
MVSAIVGWQFGFNHFAFLFSEVSQLILNHHVAVNIGQNIIYIDKLAIFEK